MVPDTYHNKQSAIATKTRALPYRVRVPLVAIALVAISVLLGALTSTLPVAAQQATATPAAASPIAPAGSMRSSTMMTSTGLLTATTIATDPLGILTTLPVTASLDVTTALTGISPTITAGKPTAIMQAILNELAAFKAPPIEQLSPRNAREVPLAGDAVTAYLAKNGKTVAPEAVGSVTHRLIPALNNDNILLRVYTPKGTGPFPLIVYIHGGGWVIANLDKYDSSARALTNAAQAVVVSVAYRQAPEHQFPASIEDVYAAYLWVTTNASTLQGDAKHIAVVGESAGGNMATAVSRLALQRGDPRPVYQVLVYPVTQLVTTTTPSAKTYAAASPLNTPMLKWFGGYYLATPAEATNIYASPLLATDLKGLPPTTIIAAEIDPLLSEGQAYANRLQAAGVPVVYQLYKGVTHEFFGMGAALPEAKQAVALAAKGLTAAFKK
ncbi:hypothetical protein BH10CHL1_BH10CHL1_01830 [soil metagenome]